MSIPPVQSPTLQGRGLADAIKAMARQLGFDLVGITTAEPSQYRDYLRGWLDSGQAGTMHWMRDRLAERIDPAAYLPGAASVICVARNYHTPLAEVPESERHDAARIARYALGDDYHEMIKQRLYDLADWLRETVPGAHTRCGVDTVPVMEKELAARAGLGWIGKNTCLIHPQVGSWLLLGEVLTTLALPIDAPETDHCGSCTRCIDACPTAAITAPYQLDARRCISYLTIEHRGEIDPGLRSLMGDWLYGCDICQEVCPHNSKAPAAIDPALRPRYPSGTMPAGAVAQWTEADYRPATRRSAMKRVKLPQIVRNARIVEENLRNRPAAAGDAGAAGPKP